MIEIKRKRALPLIGHCVCSCFQMKEVVYFFWQVFLNVCVWIYTPLQTLTLKKPVVKSWSSWFKIRKHLLKTVQTGVILLLSDQHEGSYFSSYFKTGTSQNSEMLISMSHFLSKRHCYLHVGGRKLRLGVIVLNFILKVLEVTDFECWCIQSWIHPSYYPVAHSRGPKLSAEEEWSKKVIASEPNNPLFIPGQFSASLGIR